MVRNYGKMGMGKVRTFFKNSDLSPYPWMLMEEKVGYLLKISDRNPEEREARSFGLLTGWMVAGGPRTL